MAEPTTTVPDAILRAATEAGLAYDRGAKAFDWDDYNTAVAAAVRAEVLREMGLHPEQIAERENAPGRPDSREELLARIEQPIRRKMAERILLVSEVARGLRCPTCHGKPATQPHPLDTDPTYRCGAGHVWRRPLVIEDSSAHPEVLLARVAESGELPPVPARIEENVTARPTEPEDTDR